MPVTKIGSRWESGNLIFFDKASGNTILELDNTTLAVSIPGTLTTGATQASGAFPTAGRFTVKSETIANASFPAPFFIAPAPCYLVSCYETHATKSTTGQNAQLEYLSAGTAPGSGTGMLNASLALDITNNTPQTVVVGAVSNLTTGERCGLRSSAAGATYAGGHFVATFQWV
jgi:hypothetical protein